MIASCQAFSQPLAGTVSGQSRCAGAVRETVRAVAAACSAMAKLAGETSAAATSVAASILDGFLNKAFLVVKGIGGLCDPRERDEGLPLMSRRPVLARPCHGRISNGANVKRGQVSVKLGKTWPRERGYAVWLARIRA
ncbi:hypothetical protein RHECNPAF_3680016 [Rhizobium etli CNPAF512]|nr:hypothetical protein RHECNPAF_3680016 [Rhizobium etli CNPAF512]